MLFDTAMVLSRFNNVILARVFGHADVAELAEHSSVPGKTDSLSIRKILTVMDIGTASMKYIIIIILSRMF